MSLRERIEAASGRRRAELVFKNAVYLNVFTGTFEKGDVAVSDGHVVGIGSYDGEQELDCTGKTLVPAFIDGHIHLESSVVSPAEFARIVLPKGTCAVVTDPHEITNVMGTDGVKFMLQATETLPLDVFVMLPSCVPATPFDESGASFAHPDIDLLIGHRRVLGLAEMMNYVGTASGDAEILARIEAAWKCLKPVDGHAPGLDGQMLNAYVAAGVMSDHECSTYAEAMDKLRIGQHIMIRNGTASHNLKALLPLLCDAQTASRCMLVTDDKHPGDLMTYGHIDGIIREAIALGAPPALCYKAASYGAAEYFGLRRMGAIAPGYVADLVLLDDVKSVSIEAVWRAGELVDEALLSRCQSTVEPALMARARSSMNLASLTPESFAVKGRVPIIGLVPRELLTTMEGWASDYESGLCKVAVIERHHRTGHIGLAWLKGYDIQNGAVAVTVAHDSHNLIVAGSSDADMAAAANAVIDMQGGMCVVHNGAVVASLPLPVAGLMTDLGAAQTQSAMDEIKRIAWSLGAAQDIDPVMTLSFVSLPVIPHVKLTTYGAVDVDAFALMKDEGV